MNPLTPKQRLFCDEYLKCRVQTEAYLKAGYSKRSMKKHASRLFNTPQVQAFIAEKAAALSEKAQLSAEMVLEELRRLAMANPIDYYNFSLFFWRPRGARLWCHCLRFRCY